MFYRKLFIDIRNHEYLKKHEDILFIFFNFLTRLRNFCEEKLKIFK